jgi:hypothetical protein
MGLAKCSKWMFWARGRAHCSLVRVNARAIVLWAKYASMLRACWDRILCMANGTAERVRCAMWGVALSSGAILAVGARVIGGTVPGVLFRVILRWSLGVIFSIRFAVGLRDCRIAGASEIRWTVRMGVSLITLCMSSYCMFALTLCSSAVTLCSSGGGAGGFRILLICDWRSVSKRRPFGV